MNVFAALLGMLFITQSMMISVDEVLSRYEDALGGGDALDAMESVVMYGSINGLGLQGTVYSIQKAPDLVSERVDIGPLSYEWSYSGDHGWIRDQSGSLRLLSPSELEELLILSTIGGGSSIDELRPYMEADSARSTGKYFCIRILKNSAEIYLYFNRETWLLDRLALTKLGMPMEATFSDYRQVEGVTLPFKSIQSIADAFRLEMTVDSVAVNVPVDDRLFQLPEDLITTGSGELCFVPMELDTHILVPVRINQLDGRFFLDSGAGMSCIDKSLAESLNLGVEGGLPAQGILGFDSVGVTGIDSLGIGCFTIEDLTLASVDLGGIRTADGDAVEGLLGYDFFSRFKVSCTDDDSLVISDPEIDLDMGLYEALPLEFIANVPVVHGKLAGIPGKFMIDTGNSFELILYTPFMEKTNMNDAVAEGRFGSATGIGGSNSVSMIRVDSLSIGGIGIADVEALYSPEGSGVAGAREAAGNIGIGLLRRFDWVLDYRSGTLFIKPKG